MGMLRNVYELACQHSLARQEWIGTYSTPGLLGYRNMSYNSLRPGTPCHPAAVQPTMLVGDSGHTNTQHTFRLGTFRTLSGYFLTYFFLPLREWRAQISLT